MANTERFGTFYAPWPVIDGKPLNLQWGEIRQNHAETKAMVRNSFQELQDGQDSLNAIRSLLGQAFGDIAFSNRYRFYYNKSTREFCLQKNDGTVATPSWTDVWCIRLADGQFQSVAPGGIQSDAGFYGPGLENIYQIGETGSTADESFLHRSKLFFNVDDGFELAEITSGGNQGGVEVKYTFPFGRAQEFTKVGQEWVVEHNYGISPVLVQVMDTDKRVIIPDKADVSDPNTAYFYFHDVVTGSVYIASGGVGAVSLVPRDPFYLVMRTDAQTAGQRLMHPNADVIFDSRFFYINVDLDPAAGGAHKTAHVSLDPKRLGGMTITDGNNSYISADLSNFNQDHFYVSSDLNGNPVINLKYGPTAGAGGIITLTGDRNLATTVVGVDATVALQPKLGGMKGFYFNNGDNIYAGGSIHVDVGGTERMVIGKDGVRVLDRVEAGSFYTSGLDIYDFTSSTKTIHAHQRGLFIISQHSGTGDQVQLRAVNSDPQFASGSTITVTNSGGGSTNGITLNTSAGGNLDINLKAGTGYVLSSSKNLTIDKNKLQFHKIIRANAFYTFTGELTGGGGGGVTDHGALTGLTDDDHTQYLLVSGTRAMTGDLDMGGFDLLDAASGKFGQQVTAANFYLSLGGELVPYLFNRNHFYLTPRKTDADSIEKVVNFVLDPTTIVVANTPASGPIDAGNNKIKNVGKGNTSSDAARLDDIPPGFYGMVVKQSDGVASFDGIKVINFETANFYITQNSPNTDEVQVNFRGSSGGGAGVSDHGALTGLADDDHTQYVLADGTRDITGRIGLTAGTDITGFTTVDGAVRVRDKVNAAGFYLNPGAQGLGHDFSQIDMPIDIVSPGITNYFLDSFVSQGYIIEEVVLASSTGSASVGFYILSNTEMKPRGIGITGSGGAGNNLGEFYVSPVRRAITATANNLMSVDSSLVASVLTLAGADRIRGRIRIRLSG